MNMETVADREILRGAVQQAMFCQVSGRNLDVKRAVHIEILRDGRLSRTVTVTGEVFDETVKANMDATLAKYPAFSLKIYDGRELF